MLRFVAVPLVRMFSHNLQNSNHVWHAGPVMLGTQMLTEAGRCNGGLVDYVPAYQAGFQYWQSVVLFLLFAAQQLELLEARSGAAPVQVGSTVRQGRQAWNQGLSGNSPPAALGRTPCGVISLRYCGMRSSAAAWRVRPRYLYKRWPRRLEITFCSLCTEAEFMNIQFR